MEHDHGLRQWKAADVVNGAFQGDTSSTPSFSRAKRLVVEEICQVAGERGMWIQSLSLIADLRIAVDASRVDELVEIVDEKGVGDHPEI